MEVVKEQLMDKYNISEADYKTLELIIVRAIPHKAGKTCISIHYHIFNYFFHRSSVEVQRCLLFCNNCHHYNWYAWNEIQAKFSMAIFFLFRLWSQLSNDNRWKNILHVLRVSRNTSWSRNVPEHW